MKSKFFFTKKICFLVAFLVTSNLPAYSISQADEAYVRNLLTNFNSLKVDDAVLSRVTSILETNPDSTKTRFVMGMILERRGFENLAMEQYKKCVKADPKNYNYHFQLMLVALKAKESKLAVDEMFVCQKLANGDGLLLLKLGLTMENVGFTMLANQIYEQAANAKTKAYGVGYSLAKLRMSQGRFDEALECLSWDLVKQPNSAKANILKGEILLRLSMPKDATKYFLLAFKANPCESDAARLVTTELLKQGYKKAALGPALTDILCNCSNKEKFTQAKRVVARILKSVPEDFSKKVIQTVANNAPSNKHKQFYYLALGDIFDTINKHNLAMQAYQAGVDIKTNPRNDLAVARGYYRLGVDHEVWAREPEEALKLYKLSLAIYPQDEEVIRAHKRLESRMKVRHKDTAGRLKDSILKQMRSN